MSWLSPFSANATAPVLQEWPGSHTCRPRFMVVGAPKCGSTSLFRYLEAHPDVQQPATKELCYFSRFKRYLTHYRTGPATSWPHYLAALAGVALPRGRGRSGRQGRGRGRGGRRGRGSRAERRLQEIGAGSVHRLAKRAAEQQQLAASEQASIDLLRRSAPFCAQNKKVAFEGCPFYLHERLAATQLRATFPSMRAIALLRNPRERTVSAFNDYLRMGRIRRAAGGATARDAQMLTLVASKIEMLRSGVRQLEDFDMRILTSAVYIHGLEAR